MKLGIILQSKNPEHAWNALRLAITARKAEHAVRFFLLNEGVEIQGLSDTDPFDVATKLSEFTALHGQVSACGTCLKNRSMQETNACPVATMTDLLHLIEESDKVLVFG